MKGTRPLDNTKIRLVSACFNGTFERRNRGLFMLGVSIGGRISELLSLTIGDVWQNQKPVTNLLFDKSIVKGGEISRAVPVNVDGREAIEGLICWHDEKYKTIVPSRPLFPSRNKGGSVAMNKQTAHTRCSNMPFKRLDRDNAEVYRCELCDSAGGGRGDGTQQTYP